MDPNMMIEVGAAAVLTGFAVNGLKFAKPDVASSLVLAVALLAGIGSAFLVAISTGIVLTQQAAATTAIQGIFAMAAAAGLNRTNTAAEAKRPGGSEDLEAEVKRAEARRL